MYSIGIHWSVFLKILSGILTSPEIRTPSAHIFAVFPAVLTIPKLSLCPILKSIMLQPAGPFRDGVGVRSGDAGNRLLRDLSEKRKDGCDDGRGPGYHLCEVAERVGCLGRLHGRFGGSLERDPQYREMQFKQERQR